MTPAAAAVLAANAAFYVVFGLFAVAFVALSVITVGWAIRQDRSGRQRWLERQRTRGEAAADADPPSSGDVGPATNGHRPPADRRRRPRRPTG